MADEAITSLHMYATSMSRHLGSARNHWVYPCHVTVQNGEVHDADGPWAWFNLVTEQYRDLNLRTADAQLI